MRKVIFTLAAANATPVDAAAYMREVGLAQVETPPLSPRRGVRIFQSVVSFETWLFVRRWRARFVELFGVPERIGYYQTEFVGDLLLPTPHRKRIKWRL